MNLSSTSMTVITGATVFKHQKSRGKSKPHVCQNNGGSKPLWQSHQKNHGKKREDKHNKKSDHLVQSTSKQQDKIGRGALRQHVTYR